jgi:two-component system, response regulator PdtaR
MNSILVFSKNKQFFKHIKRILNHQNVTYDPSELQLNKLNQLIRQKNPDVLIIHQSVDCHNLSVILDYIVTRKIVPIIFIQQTASYGVVYNVLQDLFFMSIEEGKMAFLLPFAVNIAIKISDEVGLLNKKIMQLEEKIKEEKLVVQAKIKLMVDENITEEEAYRYILKQAMDQRVSKAQVSKTILNL